MFDFVEVTKASTRMCNCECCGDCPVGADNNGVDIDCSKLRLYNPDVYAELVMKWAKENPEKVYPTWKEWLIEMDVVRPAYYKDIFEIRNDSIPADIAEKLGLEPKEQSHVS